MIYLAGYIIDHDEYIVPLRYYQYEPETGKTKLLPTMGFRNERNSGIFPVKRDPVYPVSGLLIEFVAISPGRLQLIFYGIQNELWVSINEYIPWTEDTEAHFKNICKINLSQNPGQFKYLGQKFGVMKMRYHTNNASKSIYALYPFFKSLFVDSWFLDHDVSELRHCLKAFSKPDVVTYYAKEFSAKKFDYILFTYGDNYGVPPDELIEEPTS